MKYTIMFFLNTVIILIGIKNIEIAALSIILNYWLSIIAENTDKNLSNGNHKNQSEN